MLHRPLNIVFTASELELTFFPALSHFDLEHYS